MDNTEDRGKLAKLVLKGGYNWVLPWNIIATSNKKKGWVYLGIDNGQLSIAGKERPGFTHEELHSQ